MEARSDVLLAAPSESRTATVRTRSRERAGFRDGESTRGITLEVLDGPMDGTILGGDPERIRIGRVAGNDLELHGDRSVSGDHAVLGRTDDPRVWRLEDPRSTNGTWVEDADIRLSGAQMLPADACFMVGHTVIRCAPGAVESFAVDADRLRSEAERLVALFAQGVSEGYGAAIALAAAEHRSFLSDRHFFLGLATTNPGLPVFARGRGPVSSRFLAETLRRNEYWTGVRGWIDRRLRTSVLDAVVVFEDDLTFTPRLLRLLLAAEEEARRAGSDLLRPADVLHAFFAGPANRPRDLLIRDGIDPAPLLELLGAGPATERNDPTRALGRSGAPPPPPRPAASSAGAAPPPQPAPEFSRATPLPTSGDPVLDARARDTARRLYGVASLYHLAEAEDRHQALRQVLVQEVAQLPSDRRPRLLGHLQRLFPVPTASAAEALEQTRSERRGTAGSRLSQAEEVRPPQPTAAAVPWPAADIDLATVTPSDRPMVELLVDVVAFATDLEQFILSMVQNLRNPGLATQSFQLPGFSSVSIRRHARDLQGGKAPSRKALQDYLTAIRTWLIAAVMANDKAPEVWFKDFWAKVGPSAIERAPDKGGGFLKLDAVTFWERYKERARIYTPDLVVDEIQQVVRREAGEHFQQLFDKRRKP